MLNENSSFEASFSKIACQRSTFTSILFPFRNNSTSHWLKSSRKVSCFLGPYSSANYCLCYSYKTLKGSWIFEKFRYCLCSSVFQIWGSKITSLISVELLEIYCWFWTLCST